MKTLQKIKFIEEKLGSSKDAAAAAGVSEISWWRWSTGKIKPEESSDQRSITIINLLYEKLSDGQSSPTP
jgi:hypothetical protein